MADVITELRRPSTLGAVVFAVIGWLLLIWSFAQSNSDQDALRAAVGDAQKHNMQLSTELKQERDAAGTLADIATRRTAAEADTRRLQTIGTDAGRARDEAQAQLAAAQDKLKNTEADQLAVGTALKNTAGERDKLNTDLDALRQQNETLKGAFARASEQLAQKNSDLAVLNEKIAKGQATVSQQAADEAAANARMTEAQDALKTVLVQRSEAEKVLLDGATKQAEATRALADAEARVTDLGRQNDASRQALAEVADGIARSRAELATLEAEVAKRKGQIAEPAPAVAP